MSTNGATELSIHEFGDLVARYPLPCWELKTMVSWLKVISISSFCVGSPDAESHPVGLGSLEAWFLAQLWFLKSFPALVVLAHHLEGKLRGNAECCKFHLMQQGHPTG